MNALRSMASSASSILSQAVSCGSKAKPKRNINRDNCTIFDVYVQCRHIEKLIRGIDKSLQLNPGDSYRVELNDYPFELPLATPEAVQSCEDFIESHDNYQFLVSYSFLTRLE